MKPVSICLSRIQYIFNFTSEEVICIYTTTKIEILISEHYEVTLQFHLSNM